MKEKQIYIGIIAIKASKAGNGLLVRCSYDMAENIFNS